MDYNQKTTKIYQSTAKFYSDRKADKLSTTLFLLERFSKGVKGKKVLEIGFGSGVDAKWFIKHKFDYTGIEPVAAFCENLKEEFPKARIIQKDIRKVNLKEETFDGIWAMAVLLHFTDQDIKNILEKCHKWLKPGGIMYISLKKGDGAWQSEDGRFFNLFTIARFSKFLKGFKLLDSGEAIPNVYNTGKQKWLNFLIQKNEI